ncbi:uncharacterized protein SOCEGT47_011430 [Sorangium cellulosum]|uniref:Uncharacterized protein n=1 Tax=Sorangium cellulosum TaxID=56 RepID=A0A4P2PVK1_SORCE|nr:uncharacterized protein SOCEGT47_011430 [Sorangium cellulosum]
MRREIRPVNTPVSGALRALGRRGVRAHRRSGARIERAAEGAPLEPRAPWTLRR